jgi:hypothetical protein
MALHGLFEGLVEGLYSGLDLFGLGLAIVVTEGFAQRHVGDAAGSEGHGVFTEQFELLASFVRWVHQYQVSALHPFVLSPPLPTIYLPFRLFTLDIAFVLLLRAQGGTGPRLVRLCCVGSSRRLGAMGPEQCLERMDWSCLV